jgi:putative alpha-1,2-mannosidase
VDPFIGTGATLPFGMVQLSPDTQIGNRDTYSGYHYKDKSIVMPMLKLDGAVRK